MRYAVLILAGMLAAAGSACSFDNSGYLDEISVDGGLADPVTPTPGADAAPPVPPDAEPPVPPDAACPVGEALCEDAGDLICVDLQASKRHCGMCGNRCGGSERCVAGRCRDYVDGTGG